VVGVAFKSLFDTFLEDVFIRGLQKFHFLRTITNCSF